MERVEVYFGLGSNMGEREIMLMRAVNLMDEAFGTHPERISRIIESDAQGFDGQPFLEVLGQMYGSLYNQYNIYR